VQADQAAQDYAGVASTVSLSYIHPDHLNTPRLVANMSGTPVWRWDNTEPFGDSMPNEDPNNTGNVFDMPLGFAGQYRDRETGIFYNYFRDYDPVLGRYVQSDPIGLQGGINTYVYVGNTPTMMIDPTGLCECEANKKKYSNQTSAARVAIRGINPISIRRNLEYCGNVCKDKETGKYFTTGPIVGTVASCKPSAAPCPDCSYWVAYWHTHGGADPRFDSENFSPGDMDFADRTHIDGYVGTPGGMFKHYPYGSDAPYSRGRLR
jgi:RHS repeat-associated protein